MKMIKLLVLIDGTMVKVSSTMKVGTVSSDVSGEGIYGAVYAVSKRVYKKRHNKVIKKLLVDSIFDPQINFGD